MNQEVIPCQNCHGYGYVELKEDKKIVKKVECESCYGKGWFFNNRYENK